MRDLEDIKRDCEAAVPGPWHYDGMHYEITSSRAETGAHEGGDRTGYWIILSECQTRPGEYACDQFGHEYDPTFAFIAHAREDVLALIAEVERLRVERERVCEWRTVKDNWDERHFEGACEGAWMAGDDGDTPEYGGYIYCPTCGGKIAFIGGDDDE